LNIENRQSKLYSSQTNKELSTYYDEWAKEYDHELVEDGNYIAPQRGAKVLSQFVSQAARILDAGCGTGLVGEILHRNGYSNLEGMDISVEMLKQARQKNVYTLLHQKVMGEPLDFPTDSFDAIISVGVFTYGHAPSSSFDELIRISKPKGYVVFTMRMDFYEQSDFRQKMTELEEDGKWKLVEISDRFSPLSISKPGGYYQLWVYQVS
jgi:predicted TPR repeat methyltransferase